MPNISFLQVLEKTLLPLTLVVFTKLGLVFLISLLIGESWGFEEAFGGPTFLVFNFSSVDNFSLISTLSDLGVVLVCALGFSWTLFRHVHFNKDSVHPKVALRLHQKNQQGLLISTAETFSEGAVWLTLSWVIFILAFAAYYRGFTDAIIVGISLAVSFGLSYGLFLEFKKLALGTKNIDDKKN